MPKYTVTEQVDDGGSFPIHRIFSQADTLADLANAIEDASIRECLAKRKAVEEAHPDCVVEAKPTGGRVETMQRFRRGLGDVMAGN